MAVCMIAGGAGFLGSHLAEALLQRGQRVVILDNFSHGTPQNLAEFRDRVEVIPGDLRSHTLVRRALQGVDCIYHFAVPWGLLPEGEQSTPSAGVLGTWHLLLAARDAGCKNVVMAAGGEVYDRSRSGPADERSPALPATPAAKESLLAEQEAVSFARSFGLGLVRLRFFNVFGPRQGGHAAGPNVRRIIGSMLAGKRPVLYDHELGHHDILAVEEAIRGCILAADSNIQDGRVFNIGSGHSVDTQVLVARLNEMLETDLPPILAGPCTSAPPIALPDISRARAELGFSPHFSMRDSLADCVNYYRERESTRATGGKEDQFTLVADPELDPS